VHHAARQTPVMTVRVVNICTKEEVTIQFHQQDTESYFTLKYQALPIDDSITKMTDIKYQSPRHRS
jgi:hypothetical protein